MIVDFPAAGALYGGKGSRECLAFLDPSFVNAE